MEKTFNMKTLLTLIMGVISLIVVIPTIAVTMNKVKPSVTSVERHFELLFKIDLTDIDFTELDEPVVEAGPSTKYVFSITLDEDFTLDINSPNPQVNSIEELETFDNVNSFEIKYTGDTNVATILAYDGYAGYQANMNLYPIKSEIPTIIPNDFLLYLYKVNV